MFENINNPCVGDRKFKAYYYIKCIYIQKCVCVCVCVCV